MANSANHQFYPNPGAKSRCVCQRMQFGLDMFSCVYEISRSETKTEGVNEY